MDTTRVQADDVIAEGKERLAHVDDDGVTFRSHLDGSTHRFTPEVSIGIQHQLGADIIFAFDELTTLVNTRGYQESRCSGPTTGRCGAWPSTGGCPSERADKPPRRCSVSCRAPSTRICGGRRPAGWYRSLTSDGGWLRRLRHRRGAGEAEPGDHRRLGHQRTARRQAAPPAGHQRARRPVRGRRGGRRHLRLRVAVPGRPQRGGVLGDRAVQHHRRPVPARLHARSTPNVTATPAPTTPAPTCITCSRPRRCWPPRCARSTTSASSSGSSTRSVTRSRQADSTSCARTCWVAITPRQAIALFRR